MTETKTIKNLDSGGLYHIVMLTNNYWIEKENLLGLKSNLKLVEKKK